LLSFSSAYAHTNPVTHLQRLHHAEREFVTLLNMPQHSPQRRAQIEQSLHLVWAEIAEVMARNMDVAGEA
jgi:hypothetical protein